MKESTKDKMKGKMDEAAGSIKESAGRATDHKDLEREGRAQKIGGKVQDKTGDIEKVFEK